MPSTQTQSAVESSHPMRDAAARTPSAYPPSVPVTASRWGHSVGKRVLDVVVAGLALLALLPLMALLAIVVRLDSPGPVFFGQRRVGLDRRRDGTGEDRWNGRRGEDLGGRPFEMYKFRTMGSGSDAYAPSPRQRDDPRVTRVGRLLRRTCLDELPQLVNVLRGDMSIVGPRPEMPFITVTYGELERLRLRARPGITGLWQLRGSRERAIHETIELDLQYLSEQSLVTDLRILLETIGFMLRRLNY